MNVITKLIITQISTNTLKLFIRKKCHFHVITALKDFQAKGTSTNIIDEIHVE
jgi:hypothetical protein